MRPGIFLKALRVISCVALASAFAFAVPAQTNSFSGTNSATASKERIILPQSVPDPLEPFNRGIWAFNRVLLTDIIQPTAKGYRFIVRKPIRTGINNFGHNLAFPVRLLNNVLQGKFGGAKDETDRFFCNTILGGAGFVDVATKLDMPKSEADFGQTLGQWGWHPQFFIMLPIYGPSNDRDTVGLAADTAANPLTYISPYPFEIDDPLTYLSPYNYAYYAVMYNNLSDSVDDYVLFANTAQDPYSDLQYAWTFVRENKVADFRVKGSQDPATLETMQSVFFKPHDPDFPSRGKTRSVYLPSTHKELKYTVWLHPGKAAIVYIVPGLGAHRLADNALALAELVYDQGFSIATISNPYNFEFMRSASTVAMPAYTPVDVHDLHVALTAIDNKLQRVYPGRLGDRALMGYSMGAFETLYLAGTETTNSAHLLKFDRYIGINTPVRLLYGVSKLDEFYNAPLAWPMPERTTNMENTFLKVAAVTQRSLTPNSTLPFDAIESKFLIGVVFRMNLRDVIYTSQMRYDQRILTQPLNKWRREPVYDEILQYSFMDYFRDFAVPYYRGRGIDLGASDVLERASDLRTYQDALSANPKVRLMVNRNDFLLDQGDLDWLQSTFTNERLKIFEQGGHLGNLANPNVQRTILGFLQGLGPVLPPVAPTKSSAAPTNSAPLSLP